MVRLHVAYTVNGATMFDIIEASRAGIQRRKSGLDVTFPNGDGRFIQRFSKTLDSEPAAFSWLNYRDCSVIYREELS